MNQIILILWIYCLSVQTLFSQSYTSKNNYTGDWETPASWSPAWTTPQTYISGGGDFVINGFITVNGPLSFSLLSSNLIINDTLVINGDLILGSLNNVTVNGNGILIVRGKLTIGDYSNIITNNYIVITGDFLKLVSTNHGSLISNNNPAKVFIGGTILPDGITNNKLNFPALNCATPSNPYPNSNCNYGNMTDIINDPIYFFFQSTCITTTPTITAGGPTTFCDGGSVTLTSSAGSTYLWSTGATTPSINVTTAGSYTVKITNASGCMSAASVATIVTVNALPVTPTITAGGPTTFCDGGSVTLTSSAGSTYLWSTGATTPSINVTTAGSYTVKITNASGCMSAASVATIVTVNALPVTPTITAGGPTTFCDGGSVTLTSSAGSTYLWSTGATTPSINVTTAGNYTVQVTNASGCLSAASVATIVTVNALPVTPTITAGGPTTFCDGGSVTLTSSAGSTYLWSTGATTPSINVTTAGSYAVKVTNANGCLSAASVATIVTVNALPVTPTITAGGPTTFCDGGSVTLTSSAGSTYLWSTSATTPSINVTTAGSYTVKVTNASGCLSAASVATIVTVNALPVTPTITAGGPTTFCDGGSVTLTSSAGSTYLWSTGAITPSINVTTAGNYTVQVTNASGCQSTASAATTVNVNLLPEVNAGTDATIPNGTSTTIDATVTGTGPFTYSWTPSAQLISALTEDPTTVNLSTTTVYTLTATSLATSCSNANEVTITISGGALSSTPIATPGIVCAGANIQLHAIASGGSGSYTYTWTSTPIGFTSSIANPIANPTINTTYNVAVFDGFTTVNSQVVVMVNALPATPTITAGGPTTFCDGGSVTLTSSTGSTYLWSTGETTSNINVTTAGSYTVQVTNISGCQSASSEATIVTVNALPVTPNIVAGGPTTFCAGGSVTLTSSAGSTYLWSTGAITPSINITTAGSYTVRVTSASGCMSASSEATIVTVNALPVTPTITAGGPTTFCAGGSVTLTSSTGSTYLWSTGETTASINVTTAGSYTVKVTNASGCQSASSEATIVTVNALPVTPAITAGGPTTFCDGGSVSLTSSTGSTYLWSTAETTPTINVTKAGSYTVRVTSASGCMSASSETTIVTVNALPFTPTITPSGPTTFCDGDSVTLTAGAGTYYLWSNEATTPGINVTKAGSYTVQVINASGCQSAASVPTIVTINSLPAIPTITPGGPTIFCTGESVILTSSTGSTYLWSTGSTTPSLNVDKAGSYTVQVTNANGCQSATSAATVVGVTSLPLVDITSSNSSICVYDLRTLTGSPVGGTFIISDGPGTITGNVLSATGIGIINLEYIYTNVCTNKATQSIRVNENPVAIAGPDQELKFVFEAQMNAELSASESGEWSLVFGSGHISDIHSPTTLVTELSLGDNIFLWNVLNGNCEASSEVKITVYEPFVPSVITPNGDGKNDYFKIGEIAGQAELIIFNRWGNVEYTNDNYINDWDGRNNKGVELSNDTYFYILKFKNGNIKKGSILIKR